MNKELTPNQMYEKSLDILHKYDSGSELYPSHCRFISYFAQRHPNKDSLFEDWSGKIIVRKHPDYPNKCFWLIKNDGEEVNFSLKYCKAGKYSSSIENFRVACHTAIREYLRNIRKEYVEKNQLYGMFHVHHDKITFLSLIDNFIKENKINTDTIKFCKDPISFEDKNLENKWFEYHKENAILKVLSVEEHKKTHSKKS